MAEPFEKALAVFNSGLHRYVEGYSEDTKDQWEEAFATILRKTSDFGIIQRSCESPIELVLGAALAWCSDGYKLFELAPFSPFDGEYGTFYSPQVEIDKYRVDFLITCCCGGKTSRLVIECDGHDYHERTKQQAQRDKSRDRAFVAAGMPVIRFTGSELWQNPFDCAREIEGLIDPMMEALVDAHLAVLIPRETASNTSRI